MESGEISQPPKEQQPPKKSLWSKLAHPTSIFRKDPGIRVREPGARAAETQKSLPKYADFIKESRSFLGLKGNERVKHGHMQALASRYNLFPVAFLTLGFQDHLNLVIAPRKEGLLVYDPFLPTLKIIPYTSITSQSNPTRDGEILLHYMRGNGTLDMQPESLSSEGYQLPEKPLRQLGKIQTDGYNCGIACVYAALVAKKSEKERIGTEIHMRNPVAPRLRKPTVSIRNPK